MEPVVVCTYGPSGVGKTVDMGYSFPNAIFLAAPGALNSIVSVCGYKPQSAFVGTIEEATEVIQAVGTGKKFGTVVIDDFSFMAEQTFSRLELNYSGYAIWGKLREAVLTFREKSRYAGVNVVLNAWEKGPRKKDGQVVRGGPQLSGNLPEQIPALCDLVLRACYDTKRVPWGAVYRCSPDPSYVMKDRFNVATLCDPIPMNLGELLRASGIELERHSAYPDQEKEVEAISKSFSGVTRKDLETANEVYQALRASGKGVPEVKWTIRDALDRAVIRAELQRQEGAFFAPKKKSLLG